MPPKAARRERGSARRSSAAAGAGTHREREAAVSGAPFEEVCFVPEHFLWFSFLIYHTK